MRPLKHFVPLALCGIAVTLTIFTLTNNQPATGSGSSFEEDVESRAEYELMMLAGPDGKIPDHIRQKEIAFSNTLPSDGSVLRMGPNAQSQAVWTPRGPSNQGGRTRALAIDVLDENHMIAGTTSGGIWNSTDGGASWTKVTPPLEYHGITCISQDKRAGHESTWYAGSGESYGQSASGGNAWFFGNGMLKSTDNGATWTQLSSTMSNTPQIWDNLWDFNWNLALDESDTVNDVVYVACSGTVYRSLNGGSTWTAVRGGSFANFSYFADVATTRDSGIVYATLSSDGPQKGIWRSSDQGTTWTKISTSFFGDSLCERVVIGINPSNENELYFLGNSLGLGMPDTNYRGTIEYNTLWRYTYLAGDGSGSNGLWEDLSMNLPSGEQWGIFSDFASQTSYDLCVSVKPDDPNTVFIGGTSLFRNTNRFNDTASTMMIGGYQLYAAFPVINVYPNHHPDLHVITYLPSNPNIMINGHDGGISKTNNVMDSVVSWTSLNNGYITTQFYTVTLDHGTPGSNIVFGGTQDNSTFWTNNPAANAPWTNITGGDGSYCQIENGAGMYYFSTQRAKIFKATLDGSGNWTAIRRIDPIGGEDYRFINPFTLDPNNQNIMYLAGGKYLWRNDDLSQIALTNQFDSISTNWVRWNDSIPNANVMMTAVHACTTPANRVYYGTTTKRVYRIDNANTGTPTPVDISTTTMPTTGFVSCITSNPNDGNEVMICYSNYAMYSIYHSVDGGTTWTKQAGNLEQNITTGAGNGPSVRWVSIIPVSDGTVYLAATSTGLYATDTLMGTATQWVRQAENTIGNVVCDMIDFRASDGMVVVATHANGIYSATITSVNDIVTVRDLPAPASMDVTIYPNPASDNLNIRYTLDRASDVEILILDELGRIVRTTRRDNVAPGENTESMEISDLAAGMYYVRLNAGDIIETKGIIVQ